MPKNEQRRLARLQARLARIDALLERKTTDAARRKNLEAEREERALEASFLERRLARRAG